MKLYMHPFSSNACKPDFLLRHLGVEAERVVVDLQAGAQRAPEFLAINPFGKVPALVDGIVALGESQAIMRHVARKFAPALLGVGEAGMGQVDSWMCWDLGSFSPACSKLNWVAILGPMVTGQQWSEAEKLEAATALMQTAKPLEAHLGGRAWLVGDTPTLADLSLAVTAESAGFGGQRWEAFPHIAAWLGRVAALEGWRSMLPG